MKTIENKTVESEQTTVYIDNIGLVDNLNYKYLAGYTAVMYIVHTYDNTSCLLSNSCYLCLTMTLLTQNSKHYRVLNMNDTGRNGYCYNAVEQVNIWRKDFHGGIQLANTA